MLTSPSPRRIEVVDIGAVSVVRFIDTELRDDFRVQRIGDDLVRLTDELGRRKLLLDFTGVETASSSMLNRLAPLHRKTVGAGGKLGLYGIHRYIRDILLITRMARFFPILDAPNFPTADSVVAELFGDPLNPVPFAPEWRTDNVTLLAKRIRDVAEFEAMPILADALQDAGCNVTAILDHCRGHGPHVKDCWVLDHILGPLRNR